ncbi:hypothetical protein CU086_00805 [Candidatus Nasuia deltocephalinicola]|uniref:Methylenetetrahydrofolate reductase n=1 Tax=Candidatus Nasuia deltocephalincola TaxID=1160784 RepID=A0A974WPN0_9PROT|nr:hypothetical protein CU086_00805 [Candidatus Nasuia deltocephalinicola]
MLIFCLKKIISFSNICKNEIPIWILNKLQNDFYNFKNFKKLNLEIFYNFLLKIINFKLNLIHFYTMNNIYFTNIICENINNIINI